MADTYLGGGPASGADRKTFLSHVFSTTDEGKADLLNVVQYAALGVVPVMLLHQLIQYIIPDVNTEKSSVEILAEILAQLVLTLCGLVLIHRVVTFVPTYSEFRYDALSLTSLCLACLYLMFSIRTRIGVKASILYDRATELWSGAPAGQGRQNPRGKGAAAPGYVMRPAAVAGDSGPPAPTPVAAMGGGEPQPFSGFR